MKNKMTNKPLLTIDSLRTSFFTPQGEVKAVSGLSLSLEHGEVLGVVGESGSGKSVSFYSLLRLLQFPGKVVGGDIDFDNKKILELSERQMRSIRGNEISIIFQDPMTSLNPVYTIANQLVEVIRLHTDKSRAQAHARAEELLTLVGVNEPKRRLRQYPHEFSGGMRQRVMIAMALACEPKLLIADEPTTALDVTIQAQILELMRSLRTKINMSIVLITHNLGIVADLCERVAVMYAGKIVEIGTTDEIFYETRHPYTLGLLASIPKLHEREHKRLTPIDGSPVDAINLPKGCAFAARCKSCMKICLTQAPPAMQYSETHACSCWLEFKAEMEAMQKAVIQP